MNGIITGTRSKDSLLRAALMLLVMMLTTATARAQYAGSCGWGVNYSYVPATHTLTISATGSGSGEMTDFITGIDVPTPWEGYGSEIQTIVINPGVTKIGSGAFQTCINATSVTIPDGVTSIGRQAFFTCVSLPSITIPSSVTTIGKEAFSKCFGLTEITIPASVTEVADSVFYDCIALTNIFFQPATPPTLDATAFDDCYVLANIYVPSDAWAGYVAADGWNANGVRDLIHPFEGYCGDTAANDGKGVAWGLIDEDGDGTKETIVISGISGGTMKNYLSLGDVPWNAVKSDIQKAVFTADLQNVGSYAFCLCSNLTSVTFAEDAHLREIGASAFAACRGLTTFTVPATVWNIGNSAFSSCDLESVTFADGSVLTTIGEDAFGGCWRITSFTIPDGVTSIGNSAFDGCYGLKSISIPASVTSIGISAFYQCIDLATVYVERYDATSDTPITTLGKWVFDECESLAHIFVPAAAFHAYRDADRWSEYSNCMGKLLSETGDIATLSSGDDVAFLRTFTADKASTICLPFAYTPSGTEGTFYEFVGVNAEKTVVTMEAANVTADNPLQANKPYLFMPAADGELSFSGKATDISAGTETVGDWQFKGTYETIEWTSDPATIYGFASGEAYGGATDNTEVGTFIRVHTGGIRPLRAYLQYTGGSGARAMTRGATDALPETMTVRLVNSLGQTTGIGIINTRTGEATFGTWHTLSGQRLSGQPTTKGIYIHNGRKVIIK